MAKQIGLYKKTNKHDHSHTLKILLISTTWRNSFNLLLKYLTEENSFSDEGSWVIRTGSPFLL